MRARRSRRLTGWLVVMFAVLGLAAQTPALAQSDDGWSFVVTPQVWLSHVAKNGFAAAPSGAIQGGFGIVTSAGDFVTNAFQSESSPKNTLNPQWGIQLAAQKGRFTLAGSFQYVDFDTINDITYSHPEGTPFCILGACVNSGARWAKELVDTTRIDVDLSASYFFPDVVKNRLDLSAGLGFKFIYASADRSFYNLSPTANLLDNVLAPPGLYTICNNNPCTDGTFKQRVKEKSYLYGATFPMSAVAHLTNDAKWLLPLSITPLLGAEVRNDENVVYDIDLPQNASQFTGLNVKRLDGTTFAYGVTADATLRWIINETFSAYAGMRVQYIKGHDTYLAYGPLLGMSVRFGAK